MTTSDWASADVAATEWAPAAPATAAAEPAECRAPCLPGELALLTGAAAAGAALWLLWWAGVLPPGVAGFRVFPERPARGADPALWGAVMLLAAVAVVAVGGLSRGRVGSAWLLSWCGAYRGTVRRSGLLWINPLLGRRQVEVRLRHWHSRPIEATDACGVRLRASVLVVWRVRDTARACLAVDDHVRYLREQVNSVVARVLSRLPVDDFGGGGLTLRAADHVGEVLTRELAAEVRAVGIEILSARPVGIDYAPEVAGAMRRGHLAALVARHRQAMLDAVVGSVTETVRQVCQDRADGAGPGAEALPNDPTAALRGTRRMPAVHR